METLTHLYKPRTPSLATTCRATCAAPCARRRRVARVLEVTKQSERRICMQPYGRNSTGSAGNDLSAPTGLAERLPAPSAVSLSRSKDTSML